MGETQNTARMAEFLADEIFKWFKWKRVGTTNVDFNCVLKEKHNNKTHPIDAVFTYFNPYSGKQVYLNTDLKSYAKSTLSGKNFTDELNSLGKSIECAEISSEWKDNFVVAIDKPYIIDGLLFIFNHDNSSGKELDDILNQLKIDKINIKKGQRLIIFSPREIDYFYTIVNDIKNFKAQEKFKSFDDYTFFYPDLKKSRRHNTNDDEWQNPATYELLTAPWLIVKYNNPSSKFKESYIVYYNGRGDSVDEFIYLIDTLSAYQLVSSDKEVQVRFYNSHKNVVSFFEKAKDLYLQSWNLDKSRKKDLENLKPSSITSILKVQYNEFEIGMDIRGISNE
ncbi:hypothetical protein RNZ41_07910 [Moraxella sp. DOX410]|nr:hypothetical protein [Moraxella sp. DOX410]WNP27011.1 hypothetical protein RNZ41_07910 [Moraxella sp. DOX410]